MIIRQTQEGAFGNFRIIGGEGKGIGGMINESFYEPFSEGDVVQYNPSKVDGFFGDTGPNLRAAFSAQGLEPAVDYVVKKVSEPRTEGRVTAQSITLEIGGKHLGINSSFFDRVAKSK